MNIENIERNFPQFKITDASNRTPEQLSRIQKISAEVKNSFVFIKRNEKNVDFFMFYERIDNEVIGSYEYIILTVSHIHFIHKRNDYTGYLLHLKRLYNDEIQCVVCMEEKLKNFIFVISVHACAVVSASTRLNQMRARCVDTNHLQKW